METPISTSPPPKRVRGERGGRRVQRQKKLRELTEQGLYIPQSWKTLSPNSSHGSSHGAKKIPTKQQTGPGGPGSGEKSEDVQLDDVRSGEIQERPERKEDFVWVLVDRSPSPEFPSWGEAGEAEAGEAGNMESVATVAKKLIRPTRAPTKPEKPVEQKRLVLDDSPKLLWNP
ncbi:unnamed protein product [Cladocopium goreaui]|uniref:Uncharacterized protein n=1 Tax=Cladocopium goreaui TaxID=2562237 RepID=A0A9P1GN29_9DINO|nr:unnamed protein product [Cladocopium goreaui]